MLVSSMKLPKLAMKGAFASAFATPQAAGVPKTGFALSKSATFAEDGERSASERFPLDCAAFAPELEPNRIPLGLPTLPSREFKVFTARALNRPFVWAVAASPIKATA